MAELVRDARANPGASQAWREWRAFAVASSAIAVAFVIASALRKPNGWHNGATLAAILLVPSLALGWLACWIARRSWPALVRWPLALALGYHALFGPALMLAQAIDPVTRNDDVVLRAWPHVVHFINSFE
ncbi:MAG: hypothetical protein EPO68_15860 [Planctomycetota bacterium]|nr:MAG: hypothetical protein EPO68_15860 [Planctomycetota bacterium]